MANSPLGFPFGFYVADNSPIDGKYGIIAAGVWRPYNDVAEALATLPAGARYIGLTVNIANVEYWWRDGVGDVNLVIKTGVDGGWPLSGIGTFTNDVEVDMNEFNFNIHGELGTASSGFELRSDGGIDLFVYPDGFDYGTLFALDGQNVSLESYNSLTDASISLLLENGTGDNPAGLYVEGLSNNDAVDSLIVIDDTGKLCWRDAATIGAGITNTAAANELMKSDGTNAVGSGLFNPSTGVYNFGTGLAGSTITLQADGSEADVSLFFQTKGSTSSVVMSAGSNYIDVSGAGVTNSVTLGSTKVDLGRYDEAGTSRVMAPIGTSPNIDLAINPKGTGKLIASSTVGVTDSVISVFKIKHQSTGTPQAGIGVGMEFELRTSGANNETGATIEAVTTDVTPASEDFDLVFKTMASGAAAAERMRIRSDGRVSNISDPTAGQDAATKAYVDAQLGIGGSTGSVDNAILRADGTGGGTIQSSGATISDGGILTLQTNSVAQAIFERYFGNEAADNLVLRHSRSSTIGSYTALINGDEIGGIRFEASSNSNFFRAAKIKAIINGTPGSANCPTDFVFETQDGSISVPVERMRIRSDGRVSNISNPTADQDAATKAYVDAQVSGSGITNTASNNELMKSDGTNAVPSGLFSNSSGNLLGDLVQVGSGVNEAYIAPGQVVLQNNTTEERIDIFPNEIAFTYGTASTISSNGDILIGNVAVAEKMRIRSDGRISNISDPTAAQDAATKAYVDAQVSGGGITNTAASNEMMKSDGTNAIPSGLFSTTNGDITLGSANISGNRIIQAASSLANSSLTFKAKGLGTYNFEGAVQVYEVSGSSAAQLTINTIGSGNILTPNEQLFLGSSDIVYFNNTTSTKAFRIASSGGNATRTQGLNLILSGGAAYSTSGNNAGGHLYLKGGLNNGTGLHGSIGLFTESGSFGGGGGVVFVGNASALPTTSVTGGGVMFVKPADGKPYWWTGTTEYPMTGGSGTIGGSTGAVDNAILRADGTGGSAVQASLVFISDNATLTLGDSALSGSGRAITVDGSSANIGLNLNGKGVGNVNLASGLVAISPSGSNLTIGLSTSSISQLVSLVTTTQVQINATSYIGGTNGADFILAGSLWGGATGQHAGDIFLNGGVKTINDGNGGDVKIAGGTGRGAAYRGGNIALRPGQATSGLFGNITLFDLIGSFGSGENVLFIGNATTVPSSNPTGGGILYVESGALKYRGSSGTVTTIANA